MALDPRIQHFINADIDEVVTEPIETPVNAGIDARVRNVNWGFTGRVF